MKIERGDITALPYHVDVIVNSAHPTLMPGGGVCGAIHDTAGRELYKEILAYKKKYHFDELNEAEPVATEAYKLNANKVFHVVAPRYRTGDAVEESILTWCYENCISLARSKGQTSIAFPLLGAGIFGWPYEKAFTVACRALQNIKDLEVILVIYEDKDKTYRGTTSTASLEALEEQEMVYDCGDYEGGVWRQAFRYLSYWRTCLRIATTRLRYPV